MLVGIICSLFTDMIWLSSVQAPRSLPERGIVEGRMASQEKTTQHINEKENSMGNFSTLSGMLTDI